MDPLVLARMVEVMGGGAKNPSSVHTLGRDANHLVASARESISACLGVKPRELIFTASGTEGANLYLRGVCETFKSGHLITSEVEHSAVYATIKELEKKGWKVTYVPVDEQGAVRVESVREALLPETRLIALMAVNNETGVKTDIEAIARVAEERELAFFVDGVAWMGKETIVLPRGVSGASFSAHKFHGPAGVGLLVCRGEYAMAPLLTGGGQEFGKRAGTENVAGIVGVATAVELLQKCLPASMERMTRLRDRLEAGLKSLCGNIQINGTGPRICNTSNIAFDLDGETLLIALDRKRIAASHGSACASGALEPSRVLLKMGLPMKRVRSSLRFSLSRNTTEEEIDRAVEAISNAF